MEEQLLLEDLVLGLQQCTAFSSEQLPCSLYSLWMVSPIFFSWFLHSVSNILILSSFVLRTSSSWTILTFATLSSLSSIEVSNCEEVSGMPDLSGFFLGFVVLFGCPPADVTDIDGPGAVNVLSSAAIFGGETVAVLTGAVNLLEVVW